MLSLEKEKSKVIGELEGLQGDLRDKESLISELKQN